MGYELTASQAKTVTTTDMVIYNEIDTLSRAIIAAALEGELDVTVDDGTTMTNAYGTCEVIGTTVNPDSGDATYTMEINGILVFIPNNAELPLSVSIINTAAIPGLTASATVDNKLKLAFVASAAHPALVIVNQGETELFGIDSGTYPVGTSSGVAYYNMWAGITEDRKKSYEFTQVVNHFQNLGYNILAKKNTVTQNTLIWEIYW